METPATILKNRLGIKCVVDTIKKERITDKNLCNIVGGYIYLRNGGKFTASALIPCYGCYIRKSGSFYSFDDAYTFIREIRSLPLLDDAILEKYILMSRSEMAYQLKLTPIL